MLVARYFGVPGLDADSFDQAARDLNHGTLKDAWRYPTRDRDDLEGALSELLGDDVELERTGSAIRARTAKRTPRELQRIAERLAELDTRVQFVKAEESVELLVFFQNPHGYTPPSRPVVIGRPIEGRDDAQSASWCSCLCGAKHIAFVTRKAYAGQDRDDIPIRCLSCGRATLLVLGVPGGAEVHLAEELPLSRIRWLPTRDAYGPSRADYPLSKRALAGPWLPGIAGVVFGLSLVLLFHGELLGGPSDDGTYGVKQTPAPPVTATRRESPVPIDSGYTCNQRDCVIERLEALKSTAADAGATSVAEACDGVRAALDAGECDRALELARKIVDPDGGFEAIKVLTAHLALNTVLMSHCRFLRDQGDSGRR